MPYGAFGTRIYLCHDGHVVVVPPNVQFEPELDMVELKYVRGVSVNYPYGGPITAEIELMPLPDCIMKALPKYVVHIGNEMKHVESIRFKDGTEWRF